MEGYDPTPAIVRDFNDTDASVEVMSTPYDSIHSRRGWGPTGYKVQVVEHDCPADHCSFDRMIRRVDANAERRNEVRYWCLNPNCVHYAADALSHACSGSYPTRQTDTPAVFEEV